MAKHTHTLPDTGLQQNAQQSDTAFYDNGEAPLESTEVFSEENRYTGISEKHPFIPKLRGYFTAACIKTCTLRLFSDAAAPQSND